MCQSLAFVVAVIVDQAYIYRIVWSKRSFYRIAAAIVAARILNGSYPCEVGVGRIYIGAQIAQSYIEPLVTLFDVVIADGYCDGSRSLSSVMVPLPLVAV